MARRAASAQPEPRVPLSRERILQAALAIVDERGLDSLSMRKLAQELGVEAMSLYNHVESKDDLIAGILELVATEVEDPSGPDWKAALRRTAIATHDAFTRHPWAARIWNTSTKVTPERLQHGDAVLRTLREAGFSADLTYHAFHVLNGYALGYTLQEVNFPYDREQLEQMSARFLRELPEGEYPYLVEHVRQHVEPPEHEGAFAFGLDLILDGLERLRDSS